MSLWAKSYAFDDHIRYSYLHGHSVMTWSVYSRDGGLELERERANLYLSSALDDAVKRYDRPPEALLGITGKSNWQAQVHLHARAELLGWFYQSSRLRPGGGAEWSRTFNFDVQHEWRRFGFDGEYPPSREVVGVSFPHWTLMLLFGIIPALQCGNVVRTGRQARRLAAGLCPRCGYDLRASTDRCPECGTQISGAGVETGTKPE